jgi:hypothetical protein
MVPPSAIQMKTSEWTSGASLILHSESESVFVGQTPLLRPDTVKVDLQWYVDTLDEDFMDQVAHLVSSPEKVVWGRDDDVVMSPVRRHYNLQLSSPGFSTVDWTQDDDTGFGDLEDGSHDERDDDENMNHNWLSPAHSEVPSG